MARFLPLGTFIFTLTQVACASHEIIRDREYTPAVEAYQRTEPAAALEVFPVGEHQGFITAVEKGWLSQWAEIWDETWMQKQVGTFDQRNFTSITREAGIFLFQESEEGYVPSEHEVIVLHLVSAVHYAKKDRLDDAKVELRRAGYILDHFWDDPALRLWLGALWTSFGEWNEAQVDFRRAAEINHDDRLRKLSEMRRPPPAFTLHFYGNGPLVKWNDGEYEPQFLSDTNRPAMGIVEPTLPWFYRHRLRNTELRELLVKSNFMAQYLGSKSLTYAEHGLVKTAAASIRMAGLAIGLVLFGGAMYLATQSSGGGSQGMEYLAYAGIAAGAGIWRAGSNLDRELTREVKARDRQKQEDLRIYRMVRFMPNWIALDLAPPTTTVNTLTVPLGKSVFLTNHY